MSLSRTESNPIKKFYFMVEALKLKFYEKVLRSVTCVLAISPNDHNYFSRKYHNSLLIGPFHPYNHSESLTGIGDFILFHGDLSVNENEAISNSLITNVFSKIPYFCIIAVKNPSEKLTSLASHYSNIQVVSNPEKGEMASLIMNAQIHLLPALTTNGFKLKLLLALYAGRHCLINSIASKNNSLGKVCYTADSNSEIIAQIHKLMHLPFTTEMITERQKLLSENYCNLTNASRLIEIINRNFQD